MAQPIVEWFFKEDFEDAIAASQEPLPISRWDIGVVDAGDQSNDYTFLIWNNRKGTEQVSDMQNVSVTTKGFQPADAEAGTPAIVLPDDAVDMVREQWTTVWLPQLGETKEDGTEIGGADSTKHIKAHGSTTNSEGTFTPGTPPHDTTAPDTTVDVIGVPNDGTLENSAGNYIEMGAFVFVPSTASSGIQHFLLRASYQYV